MDPLVDNSAWFPWEVASCWDVADGQGDFATDILLKVAVSNAILPSKGSSTKEITFEYNCIA